VLDPKNITILIVDDDPDIRNLLMIDFRKKGFRILEAEGGRAAFGIIQREKIDLVLSDVKMPDGDGIELVDQCQAMGPARPAIILLTAFSELPVAEAVARGADSVFGKPFDRKLLMATILESLERRRA
jgi:two-component system response regulator GlrR